MLLAIFFLLLSRKRGAGKHLSNQEINWRLGLTVIYRYGHGGQDHSIAILLPATQPDQIIFRGIIMSNASLILGGARSGKSQFAENLASSFSVKHYIATAEILDTQMGERVLVHRARRDSGWNTIESPIELVETLESVDADGNFILVDCLTLWLTNLMMKEMDVNSEIKLLADWIHQSTARIVLVSNEVGLGIIPESKLARRFVDQSGLMHQELALACDSVTFVAAGLPLKLKG
jgi:adenosylcobinamide kinase/adenosylcobinamide-phosphate guanylyltransferase